MRSISSSRRADRRWAALLGSFAGGAALLATLIIAFLALESAIVFREAGPWRLLLDSTWQPLQSQFGLAPMLLATLLAAGGAVLIAAPLGIASAVFVRFLAGPGVRRATRMLLGLLAGMPSVVFGLWGLTTLVPLIGAWQPPGASLLAAILVLTLMILPTIALTADSAFAAVPAAWLRGGAALGLSQRAVVIGVALPAARAGIVAGVLLALARALGETMAVMMVAGNVVQLPSSLFDPVRVLTSNIALEMAYATDVHRSSLFASGLMLLLLVSMITLASVSLARRGHRG
jgi:phosphate transport system permease protein